MLETEAKSPNVPLRKRIEALSPWFHNLNLAGIQTAPDHFLGDFPTHKWQCMADAIPESLAGRTVLDIGCNAGFYALEMKRRGADRVVAINSGLPLSAASSACCRGDRTASRAASHVGL